ncbi:MAG: ABC transporter permease, partial [Chloroflexota bacterium]
MKMTRWLLLTVFLLYFFLLGPFVIIFVASFGAESTMAFPPSGFSLDWFVRIFETQQFITSFWISLRLGLIATGISLVFGIPVAYGLV